MTFSAIGQICLMLVIGIIAAVGVFAFASTESPAMAQTINPYCYYPYHNAYYCQCYECASAATSSGPNPRGGYGGG